MVSHSKPLIIADSSQLIALALLNLLPELNSLASKILLPMTVERVCTQNLSLPGAQRIKQAISTQLLTVTQDIDLQQSPELGTISALIDPGEAQAIAVAQLQQGLLLIDDKAGRRCAKRMGIPITGSLGVILKLKQNGRVSALRPLLEKLSRHGYRYSSPLLDQILKIANEHN
ncbi:DUF3368 domain-containing protein [Endozoicomonas ascidiicola]|uniref:DUF3368 domain-containing protein n=1 Tax=Endozoicomonas ascidiicola TaxID=1698521 RepID=UPI00082FD0DE|nr:DUF3368 domain-containing protein [Endozoicomonas ascidiicola]